MKKILFLTGAIIIGLAVISVVMGQHHVNLPPGVRQAPVLVKKAVPVMDAKSVKEIVFSEDFSGGTLDNWTIMGAGLENWTVENSNNAGGVAPEARMTYNPLFTGTTRLVSPVINTTGFTTLELSFLHFINSYYGGFWVGVATTSDGGATWNEAWELEWTSSSNYGAFEAFAVNTPDLGSANFQFCFYFEDNSDNIDFWFIDNVTLGDQILYDVATTSILGLDGYIFEEDEVYVSAEVINYGSETVSFDVLLEISDGSNVLFTSTKPVSGLAFGEEATVDFDMWIPGAAGTDYSATVTTQLLEDEIPENDQLTAGFIVFPGESYCFPSAFCNFGDGFEDFAFAGIENYGSGCSPNGYGVFTNLSASVEIGSSYTATFLSGYSNQVVSMWIDFNKDYVFSDIERVLTDFLMEEAEVEYTVDIEIPGNGLPGNTTLRIGANWSDPSSPDPCDTLDFGEWEDYSVEVTGTSIAYDAGVASIDLDTLISSGDVTPLATVKNFGLETISFPVTMTVAGTGYASTVQVTDLGFGEEVQVEFDTWNAPTGTYDVEICTALSGDQVPDNDCKTAEISTIGFDAGIAAINMGSIIFPGDVNPQATVKNYGFAAISFAVTMTIDDAGYSSTVEVTGLMAGEELLVEFDPWTGNAGQYLLEVCTELTMDENPENDCADMLVTLTENSRQKLVMEMFTGTWCVACPYAAVGVDQLHQENPGTTAVIAWHYSDDFELPEGLVRIEWYDIIGYPTVWFDGWQNFVGGYDPTSYPYYVPIYEERIGMPSNFSIDMEITALDGNDYNVNATLELVEGTNSENLAYYVVLTEKGLEYPGLEPQNYVARSVYPDAMGLPVDFSVQTTQSFNTVVTVDEEFVFENCEVVVFIQNMDTREIYQGTSRMMTEIVGTDDREGPARVLVFPNPATDRVRISNIDGAEVSIYSLNGQMLLQQKDATGTCTLDVSGLENGTYVLRVVTENEIHTSKITIIR